LEILGDGTQRKSYLHVSDTVEAMLYLFKEFLKEDKIYDAYNIGSEDWITVTEIARIVSREMGLNSEFYFTGGVDGGRGWKGDVKIMLLNIEKAKAKGWKPKMNSRKAVERTVKELLEKT